jgi:sphingomyelin phosphodiesterase acid-like 3
MGIRNMAFIRAFSRRFVRIGAYFDGTGDRLRENPGIESSAGICIRGLEVTAVKTPNLLSLCTALLMPLSAVFAQATHPAAPVPVLMLSDIHFDPFHDPAKVPALLKAPVSEWHRILSAPDSPDQQLTFADLQQACKAKGVDTPMPLLSSALAAAHARQPDPLFITVSGDLTVHKLDCLYEKFYPARTQDTYAADYSAFAAKIVAFVASELRATFPGVPVYLALGNNDSGCKDYDEDPRSAYLREDAHAFAADAISVDNASAMLHEFPALGDASVLLPAPFHRTRLIVLQDIFQSKRYAGCNGKPNEAAARQQIEWLRMKLEAARIAHEHVWVMAHIPPGIDAYSTFSKARDVCSATKPAEPEMFLGSEELVNTLMDYPDVIRLALLGHTHMDEMRLYKTTSGALIPGKLVPSISPVDGNNPAFTLAQVDPATATLLDYSVTSADNKTGVGTRWSEEYRYSTTYNQPDFSGDSLSKLMTNFLKDPGSTLSVSQSYERFYFVGDPGISANMKAAAMHLLWPGYVCSITNATTAGFRACACGPHPDVILP